LTRSYGAYREPSSNALAIACAYQNFFTYLAAFALITKPFPFTPADLSTWLLVSNLLIFVIAYIQQRQHAEKERETMRLRSKVKRFKEKTLDLVTAEATIGLEDARMMVGTLSQQPEDQGDQGLPFADDHQGGTIMMLPSPPDIDAVLGDSSTSVDGIELGKAVSFHDDEQVTWVVVLGDVSQHGHQAEKAYPFELQEELERKYKKWLSHSGGVFAKRNTTVKFDSEALGVKNMKFTYTIDWNAMEQINDQTGVCRQIKRVVVRGGKRRKSVLAPGSKPDMRRGDSKLERQKQAVARLHPSFPDELEPRALLMVRTGQLVQVSRIKSIKDVDWCYGIVVAKPEGDDDEEEHENQAASVESLKGVALRVTGGWFPASYTGAPTDEQILMYQDSQGGSAAASAAMAPPPYWVASKAATYEEMVGAILYPVDIGSDEFERVEKDFLAGAGGPRANSKLPGHTGLKVIEIQRIENMNLWQSYAAKLNSLKTRAKKEGVDSSEYERVNMFHGTSTHAVYEMLYQQGFNRSFAGKNATFYGKGCYFARDAGYSADYSGQIPNRPDVFQMLACRVAVGEYCQGVADSITPGGTPFGNFRIADKKVLYDSAVRNIKEKDPRGPQMIVTFHDAQAYPEYLLTFQKGA